MASIFLLIFLDLLESGSDRWNVHIEGAKSLIALLDQPMGPGDYPGQTVQELRNFIAKQIYQYVVHSFNAMYVLTNHMTGSKRLEQHLYGPGYSRSLLLPEYSLKTPWNNLSSGVPHTFSTPFNTFHTNETP